MRYVCPVHPDVVLYADAPKKPAGIFSGFLSFLGVFSVVLPEHMPEECPKCGISYYRHQCMKVDA